MRERYEGQGLEWLFRALWTFAIIGVLSVIGWIGYVVWRVVT